MKIRFGIGVGRSELGPTELTSLGQDIASLGFDSIWLPEVLSNATVDPLVGLAYLAAAVPGLKLGTTMLLPGRNPFRLAKSLASLDRLSSGALLVTFVPGHTDGAERTAVGVEPKSRGAMMEELLPLLRRLLAGEPIDYHGPAGRIEGTVSGLHPIQKPLEFWLGGIATRALERCGRLGDGWLPSLCSPEEAHQGRSTIEDIAASSNRTIDPEHFGVSLPYARAPLSEEILFDLARRSRGHDPSTLVPVGRDGLRRKIDEFVASGISKFVLRPLTPPAHWRRELEELACDVVDLQT